MCAGSLATPAFDQRRRDQRGKQHIDAVVGMPMPSTMQMSGGDQQQHVEIAAAEIDQRQRQREADAGHVEHADDEAGGGDDQHQLGGGDAGVPERGEEAAQVMRWPL